MLCIMQATSTRHYGEKDARLEYLSWRVWFMKRNKERVRKEEGRRIASQLQLDDEPVQVDLDEDERVETASLASELDNKAFTSQARTSTCAFTLLGAFDESSAFSVIQTQISVRHTEPDDRTPAGNRKNYRISSRSSSSVCTKAPGSCTRSSHWEEP